MNSSNRCRGVSHTPFMAGMLHIQRWYHVGRYHSVFAHVRAYAIRPYTRLFKNDGDVFVVIIPFSLTSGRMRYAPTLIRLLSRLNTVNIYIYSMIVGAGWGLYTMCNRFEMNKYTLHSWVDGRNLVKIASTNWGKMAPFDANKFNNICTTSRI